MADVIEYNFNTKKRIQKYTVIKSVCAVCFKSVIYDSRKEENEVYIHIEKNKGFCICQKCAIAIKEVVDENEWA